MTAHMRVSQHPSETDSNTAIRYLGSMSGFRLGVAAADWELWQDKLGRRRIRASSPWWCHCQWALFLAED
jgi:hypothetical protein